jgi:V-type H+-transporting ATPase subunit a
MLHKMLYEFDRSHNEAPADEDDPKPSISCIYIFKMFLAKEKALYKNLNNLKQENQTFIGFFWAPTEKEQEIITKMSVDGTQVEPYDNHNITKPTFNKTTEVTAIYQLVTDTYGVPSYQEANPTLINTVTFPLMFGLMFGDLGHGSILFFAALVLVLGHERFKGTPLEALGPLRYTLLVMGFFASYCGWLYNEFFALPLNLFPSCYGLDNREMWTATMNEDDKVEGEFTYLRTDFQCNYAVGIDPVWGLSRARLTFTNNIKMKLSVIVGIIHMLMGIVIKGTNAVYFGDLPTLFTEVLPGFIILFGLFGWMDVLIYAKWFTNLDIEDKTLTNADELNTNLQQDEDAHQEFKGDWQNNHSPSIINIMINTVFSFGKWPENENEYIAYIGDGQQQQYDIGVTWILIVLVLIPVMLFIKPCFFRGEHPKPREASDEIEMQQNGNVSGRSDESMVKKQESMMKDIDKQIKLLEPKEKDHSFSEAFIHQMIETIEFVLGSVSNTASYLRLWALSLAHS